MMRVANLGSLAVLLNVLLIAACTSSGTPTQATVASSSSGDTPTVIVSPSGEPTPTVAPPSSATGSNLPSACLPPPHDASDLEKLLPTRIAGRPLEIWSVHGERMITCISGGTPADVADLDAALASEGLGLDDISVVIAGRADVANDPPYFIFAYQLLGRPGSEFPSTTGVDFPDAAAFHEADIEGKYVLVGETAGMDQSEHARGRPYVWNGPTIHYLIVTDDERWAAEALRSLQ
jgi:hypothetical protein